MRNSTVRLFSAVFSTSLVVVAVPARADIFVNLNPYVNANLQTYTGGTNYPLGGTMLNVGGVQFLLANYPGGGTGVVQTGPASLSSPSTFDIPVNIPSAYSVAFLVNSAFGQLGYLDGFIAFSLSTGLEELEFIQGQTIRDHFNDGFNNTITEVFATANFGPDRLDCQRLVFPGPLSGGTITDIRFGGYGNNPTGQPFLAAITVGTTPIPPGVPEPSPLILGCVGGLIGAGALFWRRRRVE
jgi:hypothetical protein